MNYAAIMQPMQWKDPNDITLERQARELQRMRMLGERARLQDEAAQREQGGQFRNALAYGGVTAAAQVDPVAAQPYLKQRDDQNQRALQGIATRAHSIYSAPSPRMVAQSQGLLESFAQEAGRPLDALTDDDIRQMARNDRDQAIAAGGLDPASFPEPKAMPSAQASGPQFGNVNPGDYTPASLAKFSQTGNYGDLVRQYAPPQPVMLNTPAFGAALVDRRGGGVIQQYTTPEQERGARVLQGGADATGKVAAERQAAIAKKLSDNASAADLLDLADPLVDAATGSLVGAGVDMLANAFGFSPSGDEAIGSLKVLQAGLMLQMPRMEGPQSDRDVKLYREAAADLGNPIVPRSRKKQAIRTIRAIQGRYAARNAAAPPASAPASAGTPPARRFRVLGAEK